ncbi:MAG: DUF1292 domain-containing protein [Erysipelotrichaceae bacterium]|nr:DUF1292 domain-containing protein [Erysipelotrichaceae bacterium]
MDSDRIAIVDDEGNEKEYTVLFTFESEETNKNYVLYYDENEDEPEVMTSVFDEDGNLYPVESETEWDMIEAVFAAFTSEDE